MKNEKVLHVVASYNDGFAHIITAYFPDSNIWNAFFTKKNIGGINASFRSGCWK